MGVAPYDTVDDGRLASFGMAVGGADGIGFNVFGVVDSHKTLVDVTPGRLSDGSGHNKVRDKLAALVADLTEELAGASSGGTREVYDDVVVFSTGRLFYIWLSDASAVNREDVAVVEELDLFGGLNRSLTGGF